MKKTGKKNAKSDVWSTELNYKSETQAIRDMVKVIKKYENIS